MKRHTTVFPTYNTVCSIGFTVVKFNITIGTTGPITDGAFGQKKIKEAEFAFGKNSGWWIALGYIGLLNTLHMHGLHGIEDYKIDQRRLVPGLPMGDPHMFFLYYNL